jgi:hypothetical protein
MHHQKKFEYGMFSVHVFIIAPFINMKAFLIADFEIFFLCEYYLIWGSICLEYTFLFFPFQYVFGFVKEMCFSQAENSCVLFF